MAIKRQDTKSLHVIYAWGDRMQPIAREVCTFFKLTNVINHVNFGGCMLKGSVSAKGRFWAFSIEN
jgi:hypothetical protein